jgi:ABC-type Fe3+-hydroxamate transport system substrate-binding protein
MILNSLADLSFTPARIISLVPSQTELLHYLGADENTLGITKFCVHPSEWRRTKAIIGGTKNIDINKIKNLQPHLIIANKEENVREQIEELAKDFSVWVTDVHDLNSALQMISDIGLLIKKYSEAVALVNMIRLRFDATSVFPQKINTAYLIWRKPYMSVGADTFIHDMLCHCGLQNISADKKRYPTILIDEIKERKCQLVLLSSEPYPFKQQHVSELRLQLPGIKIMLADGEMFSWYGSRLLYAADYFKKLNIAINEIS